MLETDQCFSETRVGGTDEEALLNEKEQMMNQLRCTVVVADNKSDSRGA
jgi:hypothetical protein